MPARMECSCSRATARTLKPVEDLPSRVLRFAVGDVDNMVAAVMEMEHERHLNVYCPWAVYRHGIERGKRGEARDIVATFGLVADLDADAGRPGEPPLPAPYVIESSAGNFQPVYPFSPALEPQRAHELAQALGHKVGGDSGTKDIAHIWRVPGTLNWPNRVKVRGEKGHKPRSPDPQPVKIALPWDGTFTDPELLLAQWWPSATGRAARGPQGPHRQDRRDRRRDRSGARLGSLQQVLRCMPRCARRRNGAGRPRGHDAPASQWMRGQVPQA